MKKFLADSKMFEFEKFKRECQKNTRPFISAKKNLVDGNYLIQGDVMTSNKKLDQKNQKKVILFFEKEKKSINENNPNSVFKGYNVNEETIWFDGILPKRLEMFCNTLFDLCSQN